MDLDLPLPNDKFGDGIVVASVWQCDDSTPGRGGGEEQDMILAELIVLNPQPPYYTVGQIVGEDAAGGQHGITEIARWVMCDGRTHENINFAVHDFAQSGGDV